MAVNDDEQPAMNDDTVNLDAGILMLLQEGRIELKGMLPWSSNYTFLLQICAEDQEIQAVYKPRRGERPLWDFPAGTLCNREVAAYEVSAALGWRLAPPTILREGPHGIGSMQWFVDHNPQEHYFTFEGQFQEQIQRFVLFDAIINNADRKAGHLLLADDDQLWGIDHGVCFHQEDKLRSVIWEYAGKEIPANLVTNLKRLQLSLAQRPSPLQERLAKLLTKQEIGAMETRLNKLIGNGIFPRPGSGRHYPWPLV